MDAKRPGGVTLVAVLAWINGALGVVVGLLSLFSDEIGESNTASAIIMIVIGALVILIAGGLLRGNSAARMIITVLQVFTLASAVSHLLLSGTTFISDVISIAISVLILLLLWSRRANIFFGKT